MNRRDYSVDASNRMRKDINFKNIIIKNSYRLRQKSNDDYLNYKRYKETKNSKINRITNYKKVDDNKFLDSNDNISLDMNNNIISNKNNNNNRKFTHSRIMKNMFYNLDIDKIDQKTSAETERIKENIIPHDSFNKYQKIKVNQNKNIKIDIDYIGNNNIDNINENDSIKNNNIDNKFHNDNIKELINDLKVKKIVIDKKRKMNWKRSNSIRKIMNSLYYNSYTTPKEKYDDKDKQTLKYNPNKINIIKIKNSSNQNNNNISKMNKDINTYSTEDNSHLEINDNKEINHKKY